MDLNNNSFVKEIQEFIESYVLSCNLSKNNEYEFKDGFLSKNTTYWCSLFKNHSKSSTLYIRMKIEESNFIFGFDERIIENKFKLTWPIWKEIKLKNIEELKQIIIKYDTYI